MQLWYNNYYTLRLVYRHLLSQSSWQYIVLIIIHYTLVILYIYQIYVSYFM